MAVPVFTAKGAKSTKTPKLDKSVFNVSIKNNELLKQAYQTYLANGRKNLAKTLKRGEVRGGGRKPWAQKGTGRARFGSIRVPIWRGGGITFGPLGEENYSKKLPVASKRKAIRQALTLKSKAGSIILIEDIASKEGKTSEIKNLLDKIGAKKRIVIAVGSKTPELDRAVANLKNVELVQAQYLNVFRVMNADSIILTIEALNTVQNWLGKIKKEAK